MANIDEIGFFPHVEALGYDFGVGRRQPDAVLRLLRGAGPGGAPDQPAAARPGDGDLRQPHSAGAGGGGRDPEPARARAGVSRHRHRQHRDAQHGPAADADRPVRRISARAGGASAWRDRRLCLQRRRQADPHADARPTRLHEPRAEDPALRLRFRAAGDGAGRRIRRRPGFRDPAARHCAGRGAGHVRQGAARTGRDLAGFRNCALTNLALLEPGEAADSDRIKATLGPNVMASVYYFYDEVHEKRIDPPPFLARIWKKYCALVEQTPPEHRHFRTHEFHYTRLHPGEAELIDAELIRDTCLVGTADELVERLRALEADGLQELMFASGNSAKWRLAEDFARQVMPRL